MKIDGYVIVTPINIWDEEHREMIISHMSYRTFGLTPTEAWLRFSGYSANDIDRPKIIQKWHDKGYRIKKATLEILDD